MKIREWAGKSALIALVVGMMLSCSTTAPMPAAPAKGAGGQSSAPSAAAAQAQQSTATTPAPNANSSGTPSTAKTPPASTASDATASTAPSTTTPSSASREAAPSTQPNSGPTPSAAATPQTAPQDSSPPAPRQQPQPKPAGTAAQAPQTAPEPAPQTAPEPAPQTAPLLSAAEVNRAIMAAGGDGSFPLATGGHALEVRRQTSARSTPEVFAVFVAAAAQSDADLTELSDFSRLFKSAANPVKFTLVQFKQSDHHLAVVHRFPLGKYKVFESLRIVAIHKGADLPFAVSVSFQTPEGTDDIWETFSAGGTSQITLQQTLSRAPIVEDINNDGYLDIIVRERGIEEGTGYETFLTWYKWDGSAYKEYKTTNIVRNLRTFLAQEAALLEADKIEEFFHSALPSKALAKLRARGLSTQAIFDRVFHIAPSSPDNPNMPIYTISSISHVIFPNIFENPFTERDVHGYSFPMTVRVVTHDGVSHFYTAKVYMHRNPFVVPQFSFAVNESPGLQG